MAAPERETVTLQVQRSHGGAESFALAAGHNTSVLDLLLQAQRDHDRSLVFRSSCRIGVCGSCTVRINGREGLACRTRALGAGPLIRLEPLRSLPLVRDLAVDLVPFRDALGVAMPALMPDAAWATQPVPRAPLLRERAGGDGDCITCGACYSSCERVHGMPGYPGPAAFIRAGSLLADPRDAAHAERLAALAPWLDCSEDAACTDVCPKGLRHLPVVSWLRGMTDGDEHPDGRG